MILTPSAAFGLVLAGFLLVYAEALRPGLIVAGVLGLMAILGGSYAFFLFHPSRTGIACLCLAATLFIAEAFFRIRLVAGSLASLFVIIGAITLFSGSQRIPPSLAAGAGLPFSCLTVWLANAAHRGCRSKRRPDLP